VVRHIWYQSLASSAESWEVLLERIDRQRIQREEFFPNLVGESDIPDAVTSRIHG
jgi:hypothetical protein